MSRLDFENKFFVHFKLILINTKMLITTGTLSFQLTFFRSKYKKKPCVKLKIKIEHLSSWKNSVFLKPPKNKLYRIQRLGLRVFSWFFLHVAIIT